MKYLTLFRRPDGWGKPALVFWALLLSACSQQGTPLETEEMATLFIPGRIFTWAGHGFAGTVTLQDAGQAHLTVNARGTDTGRWWLKDGLVCSQWKNAIRGAERCASVGRLTNNSFDYELRDTALGIRLGRFSVKKETQH